MQHKTFTLNIVCIGHLLKMAPFKTVYPLLLGILFLLGISFTMYVKCGLDDGSTKSRELNNEHTCKHCFSICKVYTYKAILC